LDKFLEELRKFIKDLGFPVFVAIYTLIRLETAIQHNTEAIVLLRETLQAAIRAGALGP